MTWSHPVRVMLDLLVRLKSDGSIGRIRWRHIYPSGESVGLVDPKYRREDDLPYGWDSFVEANVQDLELLTAEEMNRVEAEVEHANPHTSKLYHDSPFFSMNTGDDLAVWFADDDVYDDEPFPEVRLRDLLFEGIDDNASSDGSKLISPQFAQRLRALCAEVLEELDKYTEDPLVDGEGLEIDGNP